MSKKTKGLRKGEKFHRDQETNTGEEKRKLISKIKNLGQRKRGLNCDRIDEPLPKFDDAPCEKVIEGRNNSFIVLGRDRPASKASGYGGRGATQCGMIDMVVGRASSYLNEDGERGVPDGIKVGSNFFSDSARIYISQKCDIDEYFGLALGSEGQRPVSEKSTSKSRSGIGLKADHVRIIGRRHVKIITGRAVAEGYGITGDTNSQGGDNTGGPGGIDFIVGNYTQPENHGVLSKLVNNLSTNDSNSGASDFFFEPVAKLQPIPKGDNLIECLETYDKMFTTLQGLVADNTRACAKISAALGILATTSLNPVGFGVAVSAAITTIRSIEGTLKNVATTYNSVAVKQNFLESNGSKYICSKHVRTV